MSDPTAPMPPAPAACEPGYTHRQTQILAITICCMIVPTLVLSLRLVTRLLVKIQLWWDDYCAFAALVRLHGQEEMREGISWCRKLTFYPAIYLWREHRCDLE